MDHPNAKEIGQKLVDLCRQNNEAEGLNTLYAQDAVSIEATFINDDNSEFIGLDAIRGKHDWWNKTMEVHSATTEGPFYHGDNKFSAIFEMDVTNRENGERFSAREIGVYTVENGKIVREEFFYQMD